MTDPTPRFPGYSEVVEIARGGQARILRAYNDRLARFEAIKIYVPATDDTAAAERAGRHFDDEARIAGAYRTPHIIVVHRSEVHDGTPCLFMEYIDGPSLRALIDDRDTKLSLSQIVSILTGAADALDELADSHVPVVHRDVKPDNILLERAGEGIGRAVLADFGVAVRVTDSQSVTGSAGTPRYVAPEQLLCAPPTPRSDQYALACTAFELFAGRPPHRATSIEDRLRQIATGAIGTVPSLAGMDRRLRRADRVFARALSVNPARRYPSSTAFVDDLAYALGVTDLRVRERATLAARRHPRLTAAAAAVTAVGLVVAGVVGYRSVSDLRETVHPTLARPGLYAPCPDLEGLGFTPDPRVTVDSRDISTSKDRLHLIGEFGAFEMVDPYDDSGGETREWRDTDGRRIFPQAFNLDPSSILIPASIVATAEWQRGLPLNAECRYLQNRDSPPDGAVLTVYSDAEPRQASRLNSAPLLEQELMLGPPRTRMIGLDDDHKTRLTTWPATRPPYDTCMARLTGHDGADASPLLVLHQARELAPTACEKLENLIDEQLRQAWRTMSPDEQRDPVSVATHADSLSDSELVRAVREGTRPCGDHAAVGLERRGDVVSTSYGAGCWYVTGRGSRVALFQVSSTLPAPSYFGEPETLSVDGDLVAGVAVSAISVSALSDGGSVPVLWVEFGDEEHADTADSDAHHLLMSMYGRAAGSQVVR